MFIVCLPLFLAFPHPTLEPLKMRKTKKGLAGALIAYILIFVLLDGVLIYSSPVTVPLFGRLVGCFGT